MEVWGDHAGVGKDAAAGNVSNGRFDTHRADVSRRDAAGAFGAGVNSNAVADEAALAIQRNLIRLVLYNSAFVNDVRPHGRIFVTPSFYRIFENIVGLTAENPDADIDVKVLEDMLDDADRQVLSGILDTVLLGEEPERQLEECIAQVRIRALSEREKEILDVLAIGAGDDEHTDGLMKQLLEIQDNIRKIKGM
jgi:hypothetical protein